MKITNKDFGVYKTEVVKWINSFGLNGWDFDFKIDGKDKDSLSTLRWNNEGRNCTFTINRDWGNNEISEENIKKSALHEVLHLIFSKATHLADKRFADKHSLEEAWEEAVNTLVNYFFKDGRNK